MINILGFTYTVNLTMSRDELGAMGKCDLKHSTLYIARDMSIEQKISTLLHEIIEAIDMHLELDIQQHRIISGLEAGLFQVLNANGVSLHILLAKASTPMGGKEVLTDGD